MFETQVYFTLFSIAYNFCEYHRDQPICYMCLPIYCVNLISCNIGPELSLVAVCLKVGISCHIEYSTFKFLYDKIMMEIVLIVCQGN